MERLAAAQAALDRSRLKRLLPVRGCVPLSPLSRGSRQCRCPRTRTATRNHRVRGLTDAVCPFQCLSAQAWVDITNDAAMQRFQVARAVSYHSRRLLGASWAALSAYLDRRRWKRGRRNVAVAFADARRVERTVAAWTAAIGRAALKRGRRTLAVRHWCVQTQKHALRAWREYWEMRCGREPRPDALSTLPARDNYDPAPSGVCARAWPRR